ncbi:MAG TPA: bifunctional adenosylcobinamide kinase/adenosylcobinamide-phosphate guanylyltransferase [Candidatus Binatia bacterium]|nr:bifunctional adenosylcobinamide kinase/adenosylcobinamide-phosphate guanylyltransferase [Candidatus Binatia bacterium]
MILVTGGARAGKSLYAEARAEGSGQKRVYIATAEAKDEEMSRRIAEHRNRRGHLWVTIEEPENLPETLLSQRAQTDVVLVDCITLWLSNLLLRHSAESAARRVDELAEILPGLDFHVILVTNELGWGIVPDNALARQFRDLAGWANQRIASVANEVVLMVAGVPMIVKKETACP